MSTAMPTIAESQIETEQSIDLLNQHHESLLGLLDKLGDRIMDLSSEQYVNSHRLVSSPD